MTRHCEPQLHVGELYLYEYDLNQTLYLYSKCNAYFSFIYFFCLKEIKTAIDGINTYVNP